MEVIKESGVTTEEIPLTGSKRPQSEEEFMQEQAAAEDKTNAKKEDERPTESTEPKQKQAGPGDNKPPAARRSLSDIEEKLQHRISVLMEKLDKTDSKMESIMAERTEIEAELRGVKTSLDIVKTPGKLDDN